MKQIRYRIELPSLMAELGLPMTAAEIGVAEGFNSADLLSNGIKTLYMVDAWRNLNQSVDGNNVQSWHDKNYNDAIERVKNYPTAFIICRGLSVEMSKQIPDNSLGLVYIDCDHSYEGVKADIEAYFPKLVDGGIMAFHDYENKAYGVKRAVQEFCNGKFKIHLLPENKEEDAGAFFLNK